MQNVRNGSRPVLPEMSRRERMGRIIRSRRWSQFDHGGSICLRGRRRPELVRGTRSGGDCGKPGVERQAVLGLPTRSNQEISKWLAGKRTEARDGARISRLVGLLRNEMGEWNSRLEKGAAATSDWSCCGTMDGLRESCAGGLLGRYGDATRVEFCRREKGNSIGGGAVGTRITDSRITEAAPFGIDRGCECTMSEEGELSRSRQRQETRTGTARRIDRWPCFGRVGGANREHTRRREARVGTPGKGRIGEKP